MSDLKEVSSLVAKYFSSNANFYVKQVGDGSYRKTPGTVNASLIHTVLTSRQSIACYQRNVDHSMNWICFDFDILKTNLGTSKQQSCELELIKSVRQFKFFLESCDINHVVEFSGNRGIHIWIFFETPIFPHTAFEIVKHLIDESGISIDRTMIGLDLFPSSAAHKSSYGKAVKCPLSLHTKSGNYAVLLSNVPTGFEEVSFKNIDANLLREQLDILRNCKTETIDSLEQKLKAQFRYTEALNSGFGRVNGIILSTESLNVIELVTHWKSIPLVAVLGLDISNKDLSLSRRELVVGLLSRLRNCKQEPIGNEVLMEIFSSMQNFDPEKTLKGLERLKFLPFPTQELIEAICNVRHNSRLQISELLALVIPNFDRLDDGLFQLGEIDLEVTRIAESNYLYQNDEVRCSMVIEELATIDSKVLANEFDHFIEGNEPIQFFRHFRNEKNKEFPRELVSLSASARLFSTWAIKHLSFVYEYESSPNSFGYKLNKNFSGGHIFKPWLYQWIEFLSDISEVLDNEFNAGSFIVKTDIKSFYDSIPQDNLERLLLTGFNESISLSLKSLSPVSLERHNKIVSSVHRITKACNAGRIGLPQGPAYARVFAEFYLSQLDELMDNFLESGEISFYHRYVDDIFFVVASNNQAQEKLQSVRELLSLLGLSLNEEKTSITRIDNFRGEFDKYRAQAKYAVDAVSRNVLRATDYEKNLALLEYSKLIAEQDENDDAAFLFSHLPGFSIADDYRNKSIYNIIQAGFGRGSLFKHVFIHLLNSPMLWVEFTKISRLSDLQSEIFTSVCVEILSDQREISVELRNFICAQLSKLNVTPIVNQHLIYLQLYFDLGIDITKLPVHDILKCIRISENPERLVINENVVNVVSSTLNGIEDLGVFVAHLFPMCIGANIDKNSLDALANIFAAKLVIDEKNNRLKIDSCGESIKFRAHAIQYYQLLSLFTLSSSIKSISLIQKSWEFCANLFNSFEELSNGLRRALWYRNFRVLSINTAHLHAVAAISSEGAIWRGIQDRHGIYLNFHNALMVWLLTGEVNENVEDLREAISDLQDIGPFYQWLSDGNVELFPTQPWFIENLVRNDCILLKKSSEVLIRKRIDGFVSSGATADTVAPSLIGYANKIVPYDFRTNRSVLEYILSNDSFYTKLEAISSIIKKYKNESNCLPNFFSNAALISTHDCTLFSDELFVSQHLIIENGNKVNAAISNFSNFIKYLFSMVEHDVSPAFPSSSSPVTLVEFYSKYLRTLDASNEVPQFLSHFLTISAGSAQSSDEALFDLAIAGALYATHNDSEAEKPYSRIKKFLTSYNDVHKSFRTKHIYMVNQEDVFIKANLDLFFKSLRIPIERAKQSYPHLYIGLADDIELYLSDLRELVAEIKPEVTLSQFVLTNVSQSVIAEKVTSNGVAYPFDDVVVVNPASGTNELFSAAHHGYLMQSSEDIFAHILDSKIYLFFMPKELTIGFADENDRVNCYFGQASNTQSLIPYPYLDSDATLELFDVSKAAFVVSANRAISLEDARSKTKEWLRHFPSDLRENLLAIIESHEFMSAKEISDLRAKFDELRLKNENPFLIKRFRDFGGIHRILAADAELARALDNCGPDAILSDSKEASLFADVGLSGSQISNALDYYLDKNAREIDDIYFASSSEDRYCIGEKLRSLETINLHFVLYTQKCVEMVRQVLDRNGITAKLIAYGRDISDSAFLGTTVKLSANKKSSVVKMLSDSDIVEQLMRNTFGLNKARRKSLKSKLKDLNELNLVSRFHSMPKGSLDFLTTDFRGFPNSCLLERVRELSDR